MQLQQVLYYRAALIGLILVTFQTCTRLNILCNQRALWLNLLVHYQATLEPRLHWPDRPLHCYGAMELQQLVLQPFKVGCSMKADNLCPSTCRSLVVHNGWCHLSSELIRGGRWFLLGTKDGSILYFDLDELDTKPRELIPSPYSKQPFPTYPHFVVDMDDTAPELAFNLALIVTHTDNWETPSSCRPYQIWRIKAVHDDQGHVVDLKPEMLVSFDGSRTGSIASISLRQNILAYSVRDRQFTTIIHWTEAEGPPWMQQVIPKSFEVCHPNLVCTGFV